MGWRWEVADAGERILISCPQSPLRDLVDSARVWSESPPEVGHFGHFGQFGELAQLAQVARIAQTAPLPGVSHYQICHVISSFHALAGILPLPRLVSARYYYQM